MDRATGESISLPEPQRDGGMSVWRAIAERRSRRSFAPDSLSLQTIGTVCWAVQGVTDESDGFRAAPSAGATYPLSVVVVVGSDGVPQLDAGVYRYDPGDHTLTQRVAGDRRADLRAACNDQSWIEAAPVTLILAADPDRTARQYGDRGRDRYVPVEVGHAGQNLYLAAEALDLGTVVVGAFDDEAVARLVDMPAEEIPMAVYPIGTPR
ncbi:MAG: SagB/ThcOx family dehydrogenase [Halanaeroarchaeum sp.]